LSRKKNQISDHFLQTYANYTKHYQNKSYINQDLNILKVYIFQHFLNFLVLLVIATIFIQWNYFISTR